MKRKILFIERKPFGMISIELAFRSIAAELSSDFDVEFQQVPYGNSPLDIIRNIVFFKPRPADIYHVTGHVHYMVLRLPALRTVLSIMDVRFLYTHPGPRRWTLKKIYLDWPLSKAKYVTAISEHTASEIAKYAGNIGGKIRVLTLPLLRPFSTVADREVNKVPRILQIGTMENKNLLNLAKALNGLACKLRIVGRLSSEQVEALRQNSVDYDAVEGLTDEEMNSEYEMADLVTYCSLYEGFGLPIIEAQAMKRPVITSDLSPMKETAGGGAFLVDPHDPVSIRKGIEAVLCDDKLRTQLIEAGSNNAKRYAPDIVADQYRKLYREMLRASG